MCVGKIDKVTFGRAKKLNFSSTAVDALTIHTSQLTVSLYNCLSFKIKHTEIILRSIVLASSSLRPWKLDPLILILKVSLSSLMLCFVWILKLLSWQGRATLIKLVSQAIPTYTMSTIQFPRIFVINWMLSFNGSGGTQNLALGLISHPWHGHLYAGPKRKMA